ncbi:lecithin retinol acyltransferase family protein [Marinospirillum perlucidum]|uniref:lecithin retinol acyltransferase family protein n=1 Tax=Marinospirillum perlucidum TaxID=1982602 RepID=UPI00138FD602|nr:lecithin retinol acyltransferase family protein [Marinospirillum perlucidum]
MKQQFRLGDHLVVARTAYSHHGIYVGNGQVIHYAGGIPGLQEATDDSSIQQTTLEGFGNGKPIKIKIHDQSLYSEEEVVARAKSRLKEDQYHAFFHNCEHFANWCHEGVPTSPQVQAGTTAAAVASAATLAGGPITRTLATAAGGGATLGTFGGPAGIAIGAGLGLITWGVYRTLKK